jgi:hypothetical protein
VLWTSLNRLSFSLVDYSPAAIPFPKCQYD